MGLIGVGGFVVRNGHEGREGEKSLRRNAKGRRGRRLSIREGPKAGRKRVKTGMKPGRKRVESGIEAGWKGKEAGSSGMGVRARRGGKRRVGVGRGEWARHNEAERKQGI